MPSRPSIASSPFIVAVASWLIPGAGYWLIGQRARGTTIGVCVLTLFILGLLIGGIRVIDVPGYDDNGQPILVNLANADNVIVGRRWVMAAAPLSELRQKPWSVAQVLTGPIGLVAADASLWAAQPTPPPPGSPAGAPLGPPRGAKSHVRVNEIGTLYTAVAGMLNLLAIIDAGYRASRRPAQSAGGFEIESAAPATPPQSHAEVVA